MGRTFLDTLPAKLTFNRVDISQVVLHGDGIEWTNLHTLAATYAGYLTYLARQGPFVLIDTRYINLTVLLVALTQLNDVVGASCYTGIASSTVLINHIR